MADAAHRYIINEWPEVFYTGRTKAGHHVLLGVQFPEVVAVVFAPDGSLEGVVSQPLREPVINPDTHDVKADVEQMKTRLGFLPSAIQVKEFFVPERWIGVKKLPDHYEEALEHPERFPEEDLPILKDQIQDWVDRGDFVLYWCEDYYLNREGVVQSS